MIYILIFKKNPICMGIWVGKLFVYSYLILLHFTLGRLIVSLFLGFSVYFCKIMLRHFEASTCLPKPKVDTEYKPRGNHCPPHVFLGAVMVRFYFPKPISCMAFEYLLFS